MQELSRRIVEYEEFSASCPVQLVISIESLPGRIRGRLAETD